MEHAGIPSHHVSRSQNNQTRVKTNFAQQKSNQAQSSKFVKFVENKFQVYLRCFLLQDPLGIQAKRIIKGDHIDVYTRPVMPMLKDKTSVAVAFLNRWTEGTPLTVSMKLSDLGLDHPNGYKASNVITGADLGFYHPQDSFHESVNPTGILVVKFTIKSAKYHPQHQHHEDENYDSKKVRHSCLNEMLKFINLCLKDKVSVSYPGLTGWKSEL